MVLMPCGKCCDKCTCQSCQCCECDGTIPSDTAKTPTARWARFMSGKLGTTAAANVVSDLPCVPSIATYTRYFSPRSYDRIKDLLPDCQIARRWASQSACVNALIAGEVAAIVAAGEPYEWDPWYGWCRSTFTGQAVTIEATFGSDAKASVTKQAECKITEITVSDGGSGYARYARKAPTLTIAGGSGTGATITPTLSSSGSPTVWALASATASGGSGYVDGESLTITAAIGDTTVTKATVTVTARSQPSLTATAGGSGSGATLGVAVAETGDTPKTWNISAISVSNGGTGYKAGDPVTLGYSSNVVVSGSTSASVVVSDERTEPEFSVDASGANGTGATFSFSYAYDSVYNDYELTAINVTNGGSGYSTGGTVVLNKSSDTTAEGNSLPWSGPITLTYTVSGGAITGVSGWGVPLDGLYGWRLAGIIESVNYDPQTKYHNKVGAASAVTVTNGGQYYREDKSATPDVATLTIYTTNKGAAADFSGTIDTNTESATFGKITAISYTGTGAGGQPLLPTPTSALTPADRQTLLDAWCAGSNSGPYTSGFWENLSKHAPVEFADQAEVEDKIAALFGAGGPMDAAASYKGYCSERTLLAGGYLLGWSTPYRKGFPLTPSKMAELCSDGVPWKKQPSETYPAVFEAWGAGIFANDNVPPVRDVTLTGTTGNNVIDRLLETGTRGKSVVEDELDDPLTDYAKAVTFESRETCDDIDVGDVNADVPLAGLKWIKISASTLNAGDPVETWELTIGFRPCEPKSNFPPTGNPGPYVAEYLLTVTDHATNTTTDITGDLIETTLAFRPYASQADCEAANMRPDGSCASDAWQTFGNDNGLEFTCCYGYASDTDQYDE
jgi:hypothetical protein